VFFSKKPRPVRALVPSLQPCEPRRLLAVSSALDLQGATDGVVAPLSSGAPQDPTDPSDLSPPCDGGPDSGAGGTTDPTQPPAGDGSGGDADDTNPGDEPDLPLIGKIAWG
jgi:hypothetical protein